MVLPAVIVLARREISDLRPGTGSQPRGCGMSFWTFGAGPNCDACAASEIQPQARFDGTPARVLAHAADGSYRGRSVDVGCRPTEIRVVADVAHRRGELHLQALGDRKILNDGNVVLVQPGPFQDVQPAVPRPARRVRCEARCIEPVVDGALAGRQVAVAQAVRTPTEGGWVVRIVPGRSGTEERPLLHVTDPVKLPPSEYVVHHPGRVGHVAAPMSHRDAPLRVAAHAVPGGVGRAVPQQLRPRVVDALRVRQVVGPGPVRLKAYLPHFALYFEGHGVVTLRAVGAGGGDADELWVRQRPGVRSRAWRQRRGGVDAQRVIHTVVPGPHIG